ncbi:C2H2-type zinc finger-containing protein [Dictyostelium discoideum AX4]|uniref:C2H2-type zinc finger-containing protein n=1 Tax=Dictyostelium discoideum TaxID=44689 RepID=B0G164_DICDI|nr:C2H2-type zinc finger-containing protein [Dictyostelium discoideum AX4]EDR41044.1 C2H2-type zinc finger-containing protein [Dictyostelium discoideum AX4]|eukprot:XP_001733027.1 C2H2-type zinc finger-containing protein [Dictyostelium discoideum AX4]
MHQGSPPNNNQKSPVASPNTVLKQIENGKFRINFTAKKTTNPDDNITLADDPLNITSEKEIEVGNNNNNLNENFKNNEESMDIEKSINKINGGSKENGSENTITNGKNENGNHINSNDSKNDNLENNKKLNGKNEDENNNENSSKENENSNENSNNMNNKGKEKEALKPIIEVPEEEMIQNSSNNKNKNTENTENTEDTNKNKNENKNYFNYKGRNNLSEEDDLVATNRLVEEYMLKTPPLTKQLFQMDKNQIETFRIESMNKYLENYKASKYSNITSNKNNNVNNINNNSQQQNNNTMVIPITTTTTSTTASIKSAPTSPTATATTTTTNSISTRRMTATASSTSSPTSPPPSSPPNLSVQQQQQQQQQQQLRQQQQQLQQQIEQMQQLMNEEEAQQKDDSLGEKGSVSMENLAYLDQPIYISNDAPTEPFIVCQIWGCGQLFTAREYRNHLENEHDSLNCNANGNQNYFSGYNHNNNGVDVISYSQLTDRNSMDRYSKGSLPVLINGLPKNWNISNYNLQYLFQKLPFNNAMWSRLNFNTATTQWVGNVNKFQKTVNSPNRSFHKNFCLKVSFDIPVSWEPLPYFNLNYFNVVQQTTSSCSGSGNGSSNGIGNGIVNDNNNSNSLKGGAGQGFLKSFLFIGNQGSIVSLHRNFSDVSISMFKGSQRVILFPPNKILEMAAYNRYLLNHHKDRTKYIYFDYYLSPEDLELIQRFGGKSVILNKEDTLYIPAGWYYQINILEEETISLNYFNLTTYNLEFYIQNFKQSNDIILADLFKAILLDYFSRCNYWINNQNQYILKENQSILFVADKEQKYWNSYGVELKNQSVYQQILMALQEGFILSSSTLLVNNSIISKRQFQEQLKQQQRNSKPIITINHPHQNFYHPYLSQRFLLSSSTPNTTTTSATTSTSSLLSSSSKNLLNIIDQINVIDSNFCDNLKKITHDLNFILISIATR